jgi:dTDP-4-dehydrorhamnose reductase
MQTVLIFGRKGYLAQAFAGYWTGAMRVHPSKVDVTDIHAVKAEIYKVKPTFVLNASGVTHSKAVGNIDGCEESHEMMTKTRHVNTFGAMIVRDACEAAGLPLVHLGSGCVYDGFDGFPIEETVKPNPVSWYGTTKAEGDMAVAEYPRALVVRLRMPFGTQDHPRNLLTKLTKYTHVIDAPNSITHVPSLLRATTQLIQKGVTGIVHVAQPDAISPYLLVKALGFDVKPWTPAQLNAAVKAKRSNCVLSTQKLQSYGIVLPSVTRILGLRLECITD